MLRDMAPMDMMGWMTVGNATVPAVSAGSRRYAALALYFQIGKKNIIRKCLEFSETHEKKIL